MNLEDAVKYAQRYARGRIIVGAVVADGSKFYFLFVEYSKEDEWLMATIYGGVLLSTDTELATYCADNIQTLELLLPTPFRNLNFKKVYKRQTNEVLVEDSLIEFFPVLNRFKKPVFTDSDIATFQNYSEKMVADFNSSNN